MLRNSFQLFDLLEANNHSLWYAPTNQIIKDGQDNGESTANFTL